MIIFYKPSKKYEKTKVKKTFYFFSTNQKLYPSLSFFYSKTFKKEIITGSLKLIIAMTYSMLKKFYIELVLIPLKTLAVPMQYFKTISFEHPNISLNIERILV